MVAQELRSLDGIDLLETLNPAERTALEKQCRWKTYSPNEVIVEKGDESTEVFFILDGDVRIANYSTTGREITYATLGAGAFFWRDCSVGPAAALGLGGRLERLCCC